MFLTPLSAKITTLDKTDKNLTNFEPKYLQSSISEAKQFD